MDFHPKNEPGPPPIDSNGQRNMSASMSISETVSAMQASVDRFKEVSLARDAKHKAEIDSLLEKFELERVLRFQAEEEFKRAQENYESLLGKVKESELMRKRVDDNDNSNVVAELRNRVAELENEKLKFEDANKKNLETIEKFRAEITKLARKEINADSEPLENSENLKTIKNLRAEITKLARKEINATDSEPLENSEKNNSVGGNTEGDHQAPLQRNIVTATGHTLGASDKKTRKIAVKKRKSEKPLVQAKRTTKKAVRESRHEKYQPTRRTCVIDTRCSPGRLASVCNQLSDDQRDDVIAMGFGSLLRLPKGHVNRSLLLALVNSYDLVTNQLITAAGRIHITWGDVGSVFNIPHTGITMSYLSLGQEQVETVQPFRNKTAHQLKQMLLSSQPGPTFRRAFLIYAMMVFFFPTMNTIISPKMLPLIVDVDNPSRYNWSRHILEFLVDGIRGFKEGRALCLIGCVFVLEVLYFHWQTYGTFNPRTQPFPPWLAYWTEERLAEAVATELRSPLGIVKGDALPQRLPPLRPRREVIQMEAQEEPLLLTALENVEENASDPTSEEHVEEPAANLC